MNVALIGYRGTGKTTVGRLLASHWNFTFRDADAELERQAGCTIRELFASHGEPYFRDLESQVLAALLRNDQQVLSLGGGVVLRAENRQLLQSDAATVVWLTASPETIFTRIYADPATLSQRPALTAASPFEEIVQLLQARHPLYTACADYTVNTEGKTPEQIVAEVVSLVKIKTE